MNSNVMTIESSNDISPRKLARTAGVLYLLLIIFGVFAELYVRQRLTVPGDAAATESNIMANEWLFRLGFVSDLTMLTCYVLLVLVLYHLLRPFGQMLALFMVACVLISTAIMSLNMLNHFAPLLLLSGADYLSVFSADQLEALALLALELHSTGYLIAQPTFGLWLFPLGYLGLKSDYFPKFLSYALMVSAFAYLIDFGAIVLYADYSPTLSSVITAPTIVGEFGICLWLLVKGVKNQPESSRILEPVSI